jgi:transcriptional regulator with XRE-family HTH domain
MLPVELQSPKELALGLARRVKVLRLEREWTQQELAERAGVALATYQRFERTGNVSLERLLRIAVVLDARGGFDRLFVRPEARSLDELRRLSASSRRKRGKGSRAKR